MHGVGRAGEASGRARIRLRPHSLARRLARSLVREQTRPWLDRQLAEKCALVAGALITSAIRRTNDVVEFSLDIRDGTVTLRTRESQQLSWLAVGADPWEGYRHGQQITAQLAQSWGYERTETGGELWASLRVPEPPSRTAVAA
jgi:hypothetical protein